MTVCKSARISRLVEDSHFVKFKILANDISGLTTPLLYGACSFKHRSQLLGLEPKPLSWLTTTRYLLRRKRDPDPFSIYVCMNIIRPHGRIKVGVNQMQWGKITKSSPWARRQDPQYCTCILNAEEWAVFGVESAIHGPSHLSPLL